MSDEQNLDFQTVEDGQLCKWETVGTKIVGVLKSYAFRRTNKGDGNVYEVQTKNGLIPFFAPSLLHKKLKSIAIGNIVSIEYTGKTKTQGGNDLKHFDVKFTKPTEANLKAIGVEMFDNTVEEPAF